MIVTCPACNTRYRVDDAALTDPAGRDLRCAKCGHTWHHVPVPVLKPGEPIGPAPDMAPRIEPAPAAEPAGPAAVEPTPTMEPTTRPTSPATPRTARPGAGIGCLVLILILAAAIAVVVVARDRIAAAWPPAGRIYRMIGLPLEPTTAGLEIGKVLPTRTADRLIIEGDITNTAGTPRTLPPLRVALRDASLKELDSKIVDPPVARLLPGAVAHFKTEFEHPSDAATGVAVTFAPG
jgi:predicted Zn finger-like uncharacterized protein